MILESVATDWRRYRITDMWWPRPTPLCQVGPHLWTPIEAFQASFRWDLGLVVMCFEPGWYMDGASIPVLFGNVVDPIVALVPSVLHDRPYETQGGAVPYRVWTSETEYEERPFVDYLTGRPIPWDGDHPVDSERRRARADAVLIAALLANGMSLEMATRAYAAVRLCGHGAWNSIEHPMEVRPDVALERKLSQPPRRAAWMDVFGAAGMLPVPAGAA